MVNTKLIQQCPSVLSISGKLEKDELSICTDTRAYKHPSLFIAIPGSRHNPLFSVDVLLEQGCPVLIYQENLENNNKVSQLKIQHPGTCFVAVSDSVVFCQELAHKHAVNWTRRGKRIFAISGSNGKTTHKEMLSHLLRAHLGTHLVATEKNNNNHLGVPLTLFNLNPETEVCVLELGSNHPGEIKVLCDIANPNSGLVTNIGATHLEFFGTEENVYQEEGWLYHSVNQATDGKGFFLLNQDDKFLNQLPVFEGCKTYSVNSGSNFKITPQKNGVTVSGDLNGSLINTNLTGAHNKQNMAVSWIIACSLFPAAIEIFTKAASEFRPTKNRSEWCDFEQKKVYLDAYNANPSSMMVALDGFFEWLSLEGISNEKSVVILGDMNELGDGAESYHKQVGKYLEKWPSTTPIFIGRFADSYVQGLGRGTAFNDVLSLRGKSWNQLTQGKTHVFIKGSRSLQLESLLAIT